MSVAGFAEANFQDYGLENYGLASTDNSEPADWSQMGLLGFGAELDRPLGMIDGELSGLAMEYDEDDFVGDTGLVRTKMLEMCPREVAHIRSTGRPQFGAVALSDDGDIYQWTEVQGLNGYEGFFKKLRKKIKKKFRKGVKFVGRIRKGITKHAKNLIKKLPGGKYLVKIYDRVKKVAMKLTKPLKKLLGSRLGKYIGPLVAIIPGAGPVLAVGIAALRTKGKLDKIAKKFKVKINKKGQPKFSSGKQAKAFARALKAQAQAENRKSKPQIRGGRLIKTGTRRHSETMRGLGFV